MDQSNSFRETIENGGVVLGASADAFSATVIELYGELGLDFVWLDFEHHGPSPWDSVLMENLARAAELSGTELLVRIPESNPSLIRKLLDAGVRNILVPRVDNVEEVRTVVDASRFFLQGDPGERGNSTARTNTWRNSVDYIETEDNQVCVGVMIEKTTAIDNLDEILPVPGLCFAFVGPADLSIQMGKNGKENLDDEIQLITKKCNDANVPIGAIKNDPKDAKKAIEQGYQIVRIASEFGSVQEVVKHRLSRIKS